MFDALLDEVTTGGNLRIGFGLSADGVRWRAEEGAAVPVVAPGEPFWARVIRTPLGMVDEGDGTWHRQERELGRAGRDEGALCREEGKGGKGGSFGRDTAALS